MPSPRTMIDHVADAVAGMHMMNNVAAMTARTAVFSIDVPGAGVSAGWTTPEDTRLEAR